MIVQVVAYMLISAACLLHVIDSYSLQNKFLVNSRGFLNKNNQNHAIELGSSLNHFEENRIRENIDKEILNISLPAFIGLAADPLVAFVESMYVGQLGHAQHGAMGIANSAQYSISKLYNDPLLKTSTSLVAGKEGEDLSASVATAISSAALIGTMQCIIFLFWAEGILRGLGVSKHSDMLAPALSYLRWRALGTPAATVVLVSNGIFRGRGDTITPLHWTITGNIANIILVPFFTFGCNMGCAGAGAAIAVSQCLTAIPLLYQLNRAIPFNVFNSNKQKLSTAFATYFTAGGLILTRTIAKISVYAVAASAAARLGSVPMATYSLTFNLGFTAAQLCESVGIAAQALLARDVPFDTEKKQVAARHVINRALQIALFISLVLVCTISSNLDRLLSRMTSSIEVRSLATSVMPIVMLAQIVKGLSSATGTILLGGCDWLWSSLSMQTASLVCVLLIAMLPPSLNSIWIALGTFMFVQVRLSPPFDDILIHVS